MSHQERAYSRTSNARSSLGRQCMWKTERLMCIFAVYAKPRNCLAYDRFIQTVRGTGYRFSLKS